MLYTLSLALPLLMLPLSGLAKETVHGAVIFSRHGDRTAKILPPTVLTALGKNQLYNSGSFYRSRYIDANSPTQITGISVSNVVSSQLYAAAPDQVSQSSQSQTRTRTASERAIPVHTIKSSKSILTKPVYDRISSSTLDRRSSRAFIPHPLAPKP